jgi:hypothetical protein
MSVEPGRARAERFLAHQLGEALPSLRSWKERLDPARLCNPWIL